MSFPCTLHAQAVKQGLKHAEELCGGGGDWERKNRLRVYEAVFLMATRDLARAAALLLDSIATFTSCARTPGCIGRGHGALVLVAVRDLARAAVLPPEAIDPQRRIR